MLPKDKTDGDLVCEAIFAEELFSGLSPLDRRELDSIEERVKMLPEHTVFTSGDQPRYIYVHRSGRATLFNAKQKDLSLICPVEPDRIYGITEALSGDAFNVGLRTITDSDFDLIARDEFLRFIHRQPSVSFKLARMLSRLYQNMLKRLKSH